MRGFLIFLFGLLLGAIAALVLVGMRAGDLMVAERPSPHGLEETVAKIRTAAEADGWVVQNVQKLEESIKKNGGGDVRPIRLINLCQAHHAEKMMNVDTARKMSVFMPCTISVYEKSDGKVYIGSVNAGLMGRLYGGVVAEVMGDEVATAQDKFLEAAGN